MSKISSSADFGNVVDFDALKRWVSVWAADVTDQVNGGIDFSTNVNCKIITCSFVAANTEAAFVHGLRKKPTGYILVGTNVATSIYNGSTTWTSDLIYLKASVIANCTVLVF